MSLKPLGCRVIVKPDPPDTESASGIIFPQTYGTPPAMSGTVISVGRGPAAAHRVRGETIASCMRLLEDCAARVPSSCLYHELMNDLASYAMEQVQMSEVSEGDYVAFAYTSGAKMYIDGKEYLVLDEGDLHAAWKDESEAA